MRPRTESNTLDYVSKQPGYVFKTVDGGGRRVRQEKYRRGLDARRTCWPPTHGAGNALCVATWLPSTRPMMAPQLAALNRGCTRRLAGTSRRALRNARTISWSSSKGHVSETEVRSRSWPHRLHLPAANAVTREHRRRPHLEAMSDRPPAYADAVWTARDRCNKPGDDLRDRRRVWAASIYKSTDAGASWQGTAVGRRSSPTATAGPPHWRSTRGGRRPCTRRSTRRSSDDERRRELGADHAQPAGADHDVAERSTRSGQAPSMRRADRPGDGRYLPDDRRRMHPRRLAVSTVRRRRDQDQTLKHDNDLRRKLGAGCPQTPWGRAGCSEAPTADAPGQSHREPGEHC